MLAVVVRVVRFVRVLPSTRPLICLVTRELVCPFSRSPTYRLVRALLAHPLTGLDHLFVRLPVRLLVRLFLLLAHFLAG